VVLKFPLARQKNSLATGHQTTAYFKHWAHLDKMSMWSIVITLQQLSASVSFYQLFLTTHWTIRK
jgi:hypothetical protein